MPSVTPATMPPDMHKPTSNESTARYRGISKRYAATAPVHAPVTGKGIATNTASAASPQRSYFCVNLFLVRAKSQGKSRLQRRDFFRNNRDTGSST